MAQIDGVDLARWESKSWGSFTGFPAPGTLGRRSVNDLARQIHEDIAIYGVAAFRQGNRYKILVRPGFPGTEALLRHLEGKLVSSNPRLRLLLRQQFADEGAYAAAMQSVRSSIRTLVRVEEAR